MQEHQKYLLGLISDLIFIPMLTLISSVEVEDVLRYGAISINIIYVSLRCYFLIKKNKKP